LGEPFSPEREDVSLNMNFGRLSERSNQNQEHDSAIFAYARVTRLGEICRGTPLFTPEIDQNQANIQFNQYHSIYINDHTI